MRELATPFDFPYPYESHFMRRGTIIAAATGATAKPSEKPTSIGIPKTIREATAIAAASQQIGTNAISATIIPFPLNVMFIPPRVKIIPRQHVRSHCAHLLLNGFMTSPK
jgi:hypothetical protein